MTELLTALEASSFSIWVRESPSIWAYPTILTLHTLGLGVLVGASWMVDLRLLGFASAIPTSVLSRAFPTMWAGFWLNAFTGVLLFVGDPMRATSTVFIWKLGLVALGVVLMITLKRRLAAGTIEPARTGGGGVKVLALASLVLWVAAIATGRWMAYT